MLPNFIEMTVVEMRQAGQQIAVIEKQVRFAKDQVVALEPITLPSEMKGADGEPLGIPGTVLRLQCGAAYAVKMDWESVEKKLMGLEAEDINGTKEAKILKFEGDN